MSEYYPEWLDSFLGDLRDCDTIPSRLRYRLQKADHITRFGWQVIKWRTVHRALELVDPDSDLRGEFRWLERLRTNIPLYLADPSTKSLRRFIQPMRQGPYYISELCKSFMSEGVSYCLIDLANVMEEFGEFEVDKTILRVLTEVVIEVFEDKQPELFRKPPRLISPLSLRPPRQHHSVCQGCGVTLRYTLDCVDRTQIGRAHV